MIHSILAARTHFSIGESTLDIEELVAEAVRLEQKAVAVVDTMSVSAVIDLTKRAKAAGIKPIIGCRLRLVDDPSWRKPRGEKEKAPPEYFVTVYVRSEAGLKALYAALTVANSEEYFYHTAKLGFAEFNALIANAGADALAIASSDLFSVVAHQRARELLTPPINALGASNVYATLSPVATPLFDTLNLRAAKLAEELGCPTLVTYPTFYRPAGADAAEVMMAIAKKNKLSDPWHWKPWTRDFAPMGVRELAQRSLAAAKRIKEQRGPDLTEAFKRGLAATGELVDSVAFEWSKSPVSLPKMAEDEDAAVTAECRTGFARRLTKPSFGWQPSTEDLRERYLPRLNYELGILRKLQFCGYFLLVQDVVKWAKDNGVAVGPGRGSVGGSLVAYLMGITDVDPIRFDLLFERFINPGRQDLPDADLDFQSTRRQEIVDYLVAKWGADKVAGITNYQVLGAASALRDVARTYGLDPNRDVRCSKLVPDEHGKKAALMEAAAAVPEIGKFAVDNPELFQNAAHLEGVMRSLGRHASGMVVSGVPLIERGAVERRSGAATVNWDMRVAESQGLVKLDVLGLSTLDLLEAAKTFVFQRHSKRLDLLAIPLDDKPTLEAFAAARTVGIFQFESGGMRRLLKELGADGTLSFEDVVAAVALYRPGPMDSGMMESYGKRKRGLEAVEVDHPAMGPALAPTFGVAVYQEQVMAIARDLCGFTLPDADGLRKAMGKKLKEEMAKWEEKFIAGAASVSGCPADLAKEIWDKIAAFAGYGFNKSHAVAYALLAYQTVWLKVHFPVEFYAAALTIEEKDEKKEPIVEDARAAGIELLVPDINMSSDRFEVLTDTKLLMPFQAIKGIGGNTVAAILKARAAGKFADKADFLARVEKRRCNIGHQDKLEKVGAFAAIEPTGLPATHEHRLKDQRELLPGLVNQVYRVPRTMVVDKFVKEKLAEIVKDYFEAQKDDGVLVKPKLGSTARFVVVADCPTWAEEREGWMAQGVTFDFVSAALDEAGLKRSDAYWTAALKRPKKKGAKQIDAAEIANYLPYLQRELEALKPALILTLGSAAARIFVKDLKGGVAESAGRVVYNKDLDANIVIGFNPSMIAFDGEKQPLLNAVFQRVAQLLE